MTILGSLFTSLFGLSVVFLVLISLIILIQLQSRIIGWIHRPKNDQNAKATPVAPIPAATAPASSVTPERKPRSPLRLYDTDEKTAAMVMAIVADESGIPPEELIFHSIRLVKEH